MPPLVTLPLVTLLPGPVPVVLTVVGQDVAVELTVLEPPVPEPPPVPETDEPLPPPEMTWAVHAQSPRMSAMPRSTA